MTPKHPTARPPSLPHACPNVQTAGTTYHRLLLLLHPDHSDTQRDDSGLSSFTTVEIVPCDLGLLLSLVTWSDFVWSHGLLLLVWSNAHRPSVTSFSVLWSHGLPSFGQVIFRPLVTWPAVLWSGNFPFFGHMACRPLVMQFSVPW